MDVDAESWGFVLDEPRSRILFFSGGYPRKSYLELSGLEGGERHSMTVEGHAFIGMPHMGRDGLVAYAAAVPLGRGMRDPRSLPSERALVQVDLKKFAVNRIDELPDEASLLFVAEPAAGSEPVPIYLKSGELMVAYPGPAANTVSLGKGATAASLSTDSSELAVAFVRPGRNAALMIFDLAARKAKKEYPMPGIVGLLSFVKPGQWVLESRSSAGHALRLLDSVKSEQRVLMTVDGPIESVILGDRWLYAISLNHDRPKDPKREWMAPRDIHRLDMRGREPIWSAPWTQRPGELLKIDGDRSRLYFAITDQDAPTVWSLPTDLQSISAAGGVFDRPSSASGTWRQVGIGLLCFLGAFAVIAAVWGGLSG